MYVSVPYTEDPSPATSNTISYVTVLSGSTEEPFIKLVRQKLDGEDFYNTAREITNISSLLCPSLPCWPTPCLCSCSSCEARRSRQLTCCSLPSQSWACYPWSTPLTLRGFTSKLELAAKDTCRLQAHTVRHQCRPRLFQFVNLDFYC